MPNAPVTDARELPQAGDARSRVADILFQGVPKMRRGESAAERAQRVLHERTMDRERYQQGAMTERERMQQGAMDARSAADREARSADNTLDNETSIRVAQINAHARLNDGAGGANTPANRQLQLAIQNQKNHVDALDRTIKQAESSIPGIPSYASAKERHEHQQRYAGVMKRVAQLTEQRDRAEAIRMALIDRQIQGITEFRDLIPQAPGAAMPAPGGPAPTGQPVGHQGAPMDDEWQLAQNAAQRIMGLGLPPEEQQRRLEEVFKRYNQRTGRQ